MDIFFIKDWCFQIWNPIIANSHEEYFCWSIHSDSIKAMLNNFEVIITKTLLFTLFLWLSQAKKTQSLFNPIKEYIRTWKAGFDWTRKDVLNSFSFKDRKVTEIRFTFA